MQKIDLVVIDAQKDFCITEENGHKGTLVVPGAHDDMKRLGKFIKKYSRKINDIHSTFDSHARHHIANHNWLKDSKGNYAPPFITIDENLVGSDGVQYRCSFPQYEQYTREYIKKLRLGGRYPHCAWSVHCVIGTWGFSLVDEIADAYEQWEIDNEANVDKITKGSSLLTESFSAVMAEVPLPNDPTTHLNVGFIKTLEESDIILLAGEALNFCLANTVRDTIKSFSNTDYVRKMVLLRDATSSVVGNSFFEKLESDFLSEMTAAGVQISSTIDFFA